MRSEAMWNFCARLSQVPQGLRPSIDDMSRVSLASWRVDAELLKIWLMPYPRPSLPCSSPHGHTTPTLDHPRPGCSRSHEMRHWGRGGHWDVAKPYATGSTEAPFCRVTTLNA